jgi:8-oxo-dGTP pyrophosphatase MutT (NUDIX family)
VRRVEWIPHLPPDDLEVRQVYGFFVDEFSRAPHVLLQNDRGVYNLPGGKPERDDIDWVHTLRREALEESRMRFSSTQYLGYALVRGCGTTPYAQVRYLAKVEQLLPLAPDPATGRTYGREWVPIHELADRLAWGAHGEAQIATLAARVAAVLQAQAVDNFEVIRHDGEPWTRAE